MKHCSQCYFHLQMKDLGSVKICAGLFIKIIYQTFVGLEFFSHYIRVCSGIPC